MILIPLLDDDMNLIGNIEFEEEKEDNLTLPHVADYLNMNCRIGLKRLDHHYGKHEGRYVIMYYDTKYPKASYAEIVSKKNAYKECWIRGKLELASQLGLDFIEGDVEVDK